MEKQLLIIATLDTKGREAAYVRDCAQKLGIHPILMDIGTLGEPLAHPDITRVEVVEAAGYHWEHLVKEKSRSLAVKAVQEGGAILATDLFEKAKLHGVFGMGGGTGTAIRRDHGYTGKGGNILTAQQSGAQGTGRASEHEILCSRRGSRTTGRAGRFILRH